MQTIHLEVSDKNVPELLHTKQGDVGRKFLAVFRDGAGDYEIPVRPAKGITPPSTATVRLPSAAAPWRWRSLPKCWAAEAAVPCVW